MNRPQPVSESHAPRLGCGVSTWVATLSLACALSSAGRAWAGDPLPCEPQWANWLGSRGPSGTIATTPPPVSGLALYDDDGPGPHPEQLISTGALSPFSFPFYGIGINHWTANGWEKLGDVGLSGYGSGTYGWVVRSIDLDGPGGEPPRLYVGGHFDTADGQYSSLITGWDGLQFHPMANGVGGAFPSGGSSLGAVVFDICAYDPDGPGPAPNRIFAGGDFVSGGAPIAPAGFAVWTGSSWAGMGFSGLVRCMTVFDDDGPGPHQPELIVGGFFGNGAGVGATNIIKWNGVTWSPLGLGVGIAAASNVCTDLSVFDEDGAGPNPPRLFATGNFTTAGGVAVSGMARWDGTSWSALPAGGTGFGHSEVWDPDGAGPTTPGLYFSTLSAGNLRRWDGSAWSVPPAAQSTGVRRVFTLDSDDDGPSPSRTFALGEFIVAPSTELNNVAEWNGSAWIPLTKGFNGSTIIYTLATHDDGAGESLFVGGDFRRYNTTDLSRIARFDGSTFTALGSGLNGNPRCMLSADLDGPRGNPPRLYVGGAFTTAGGNTVNRIAQWDGANWSAVGPTTGASGEVRALCAWDDDGPGPHPTCLYAAGAFTSIGGVTASRIAKWDGTTWTDMAGGLSGNAQALLVFDDDGPGPNAPALYVGGFFATAGGVAAPAIARWDGSNWSALGDGLTSLTVGVLSLAAFDEDGPGPNPARLFAGGSFTNSGSTNINRVARWDGSAWSAVGAGAGSLNSPNGATVTSMRVFDDGTGGGPALFVAGGFRHIGAVESRGFAKWNGQTWQTFGNALWADTGSAIGFAMAVFDDGMGRSPGLFIGGAHGRAGDSPTNGLARWGCVSASPSTTRIFGLKGSTSTVGNSAPPVHLFSFNADGSGFSDIGVVKIGRTAVDVDALAWSSTHGLLAFMIEPTSSRLVSIDPATGAATPRGPALAFREIRGAAFDSSGNLLAVDAAGNELVIVDPDSGQITCPPIALQADGLPFDVHYLCDIASKSNGQMVLSAYDEQVRFQYQRIFSLEVASGTLTEIGTGGVETFSGITFADGAPLNRLFAIGVAGPDDLIACNAGSAFNQTVLVSDIIPRTNAGASDLAAIVEPLTGSVPGCPPMTGLAGSFNLDLGQSPDPGSAAQLPIAPYGGAANQPGFWNAIQGVSTAAVNPIFDLRGLTTPVTFTSSGNGDPQSEVDAAIPFDHGRLLHDSVHVGLPGVLRTFFIEGLPDGDYDVYTYGLRPLSPATLTTFDVNGLDPQSVGGAWPGAMTLGVTHALHRATVRRGSLAIHSSILGGTTSGRLNGVQVVRVQTPLCGTDINCDGLVNTDDLIALIGSWGMCPAPCPADINFDGAVNTDDLIALIGAWGAVPTGACCLPTRTCEQRTASSCTGSNGVFHGVGVSCASVQCSSVAANDFCQWATPAALGLNHWNNTGATVLGASPPNCSNSDTRDVWFTFTAPCTGWLDLDTAGTAPPFTDTFLQLYSGTACQPLGTMLQCADGWGLTNSPMARLQRYVTAGQTFLIRAGSTGFIASNQGPAILNIRCIGGPPNDACANALPAVVGANAWDATGAGNEGATSACISFPNDVWFDFIAPCTGVLTLDTFGSDGRDPTIAVFDGGVCSPLGAVLACNDDAPANFPVTFQREAYVQLNVTAGQALKIQVGCLGTTIDDMGPGVLNIRCGPPANDHCADAQPITSGSRFWSNAGADFDGPAAACAATADRDVWFSYLVPATGIVRIDTWGTAAPLSDPAVEVFDGSTCAPLGALLACSDNGPGGSLNASVDFSATQGQTILIRCMSAGASPTNVGLGRLTVVCGEPPVNDDCANAIEAFDGDNAWDNSGATLDGPLEAPCYTGATRDVWFNYTATCTGTLVISTENTTSTFDTQLVVYAGFGCAPLGTQLGCDYGSATGGGSRVILNVTAGDQLKIRCESRPLYAFAQGPSVLTIIPCAQPPTNDLCANAVNLGVGNTAPMAFSLVLASRDGNAAASVCGGSGMTNIERDIWFRWTAGPDADGRITLNINGNGVFYSAQIFEDGPCGFLNTWLSFNCVSIVPGRTYIVRVGTFNLASLYGLGTIEISGNDP